MQIIVTISEGKAPSVAVVGDKERTEAETDGEWIRRRRKNLRLRQRDLAKLAGVSVPTISGAESGRRKTAATSLRLIEQALDTYANKNK